MDLPRIIIAGTSSRVGKTTLAFGIISALRKKGLRLQAFKAGPDYIDPTYHSRASGKACVNLDSWLLSRDSVAELFTRRAADADFSVIEGVMGLYDGLKDTELGSTAQLAKMLKCPVILVLDARSMSRSAAAVALGYKEFDENINIAGIILNNTASASHYNFVKAAIERRTGIPVLGHMPRDPGLELSERHLGLIPLDEKQLAGAFRKRLSRRIGEHIDMTRLVRIGQKADPLPRPRAVIFNRTSAGARVTIAIAKDEAFNFYYQDNLDILEYLGADIVTFSPIRDRKLPDGADGLYIGGGFPELFARDLARNKSLRRSIREGATRGMPVYAECGGLMYLVDSIIDFKGRKFPMAGIFRCSVRMGERLRRMGYVDIEVIKDNIIGKAGARNRAHLFHWSRLINIPKNTSFAYRIVKDKKDEFYDGLTRGSALASYAHLHFASDRTFAENFIDSCRKYKELNGDQAE